MLDIEILKDLLIDGNNVLKTKSLRFNLSYPFFIDFYFVVDEKKFSSWKIRVLSYLEEQLGKDNISFMNFNEGVKNIKITSVKFGLGLLEGLIKDFEVKNISNKKSQKNENMEYIINIFEKFCKFVKQLRKRYNNRPTFPVKDEYDVQDLLHALLKLYFDDVRPEDCIPSYSGSSNRVDFFIKKLNTVIEVKYARNNLRDKQIGDQLIIDIEKYAQHPNCDNLLCFVYDPSGVIDNPAQLENDLRRSEPISVEVFVRPLF